MRKIFNRWIDHYFSDEEALQLFVVLALSLGVILTMGQPLTPVFAGIILAFLMQGAVSWLKSRDLPHLAAVSIVFTIFIGFFFALFFIVLPLVWRQAANLLNELPLFLGQLQQMALLLPQQYPGVVSEDTIREVTNLATKEVSQLGQWIVTFSLNSIGSVLTLLVYMILVPILVFFFLLDGSKLMKWWERFLPEKRQMMTQVWHEMDNQIANYIRGKAIEILIVGTVTYVVFMFLGLNYAALLAILVGLSVLVPYIGATIVTLPVALVGFFQWGVGNEFMWLMIAYAIIQALDGNVLVPLLFSEAVNLHPVSIIVAVLVFGGLWGFWGVFFAIPMATLVKAIMTAWPSAPKREALPE